MMTREELIEWMGIEGEYGYRGIKVVIDCPSLSEAQEVADAIESIMGGSFDTYDGTNEWWRWLWLIEDWRTERHINAYSSRSNLEAVEGWIKHVEFIQADEALRIIRGELLTSADVDDLL